MKMNTADYAKMLDGVLVAGGRERFREWLHLLAKNRELGNLGEILAVWQEQQLEQNGDEVVAVVHYREAAPSEAQQKQVAVWLTEQLKVKKVILQLQNDGQSAGLMIDAAGRRYDLTFNSQLDAFKEHLLQA